MTNLKPIPECKTVAELLADKSRWTQGWFARDESGNEVTPDDRSACCFCLVGAVEMIHGFATMDYHSAKSKLSKVLFEDIDIFNDTHTYDEVYAKVLEANI